MFESLKVWSLVGSFGWFGSSGGANLIVAVRMGGGADAAGGASPAPTGGGGGLCRVDLGDHPIR
jgi:hypothetical protein